MKKITNFQLCIAWVLFISLSNISITSAQRYELPPGLGDSTTLNIPEPPTSLQFIIDQNILGCHQESLDVIGSSDFVINEYIKSNYGYTAHAPEFAFKINKAYGFEYYPCLKLLDIYPKSGNTSNRQNLRGDILYNLCDSTLYNFGEGIEQFSRVTNINSNTLAGQSSIIDIFKLYLNTLRHFNNYYIIYSADSLQLIWRHYTDAFDSAFIKAGLPFIISYDEDELSANINTISKVAKAPNIEIKKDKFEIRLYSWEYYRGLVEYWEFAIDQTGIKQMKHKKLMESMGPCPTGWIENEHPLDY